LHFLCDAHAVCEIRSRAGETALGKGLQFKEFAVFGIELAGTIRLSDRSVFEPRSLQ
jgi:hypothetical protein